jgi:hypothetical protein
LKKEYHGKNYTFYLELTNYKGFGGEGAIRDFFWNLKGRNEEPLSAGFLGGTNTFEKAVGGEVIDVRRSEFTLKPIRDLIDGSAGAILREYSRDGYRLENIPVGRYEISAWHERRAVRLRKWNSDDEYVETLKIDFEPQIPAQCDNCVKLEYKY